MLATCAHCSIAFSNAILFSEKVAYSVIPLLSFPELLNKAMIWNAVKVDKWDCKQFATV